MISDVTSTGFSFFSNPQSEPPGSFVYHSHVLRSFKVGAHNNRIRLNSAYSLPLQRRVYISTWHIEPERSFNPSMCYQEDFVSLALFFLNSNERKKRNAQGFSRAILSLPEGSGPGIDLFQPRVQSNSVMVGPWPCYHHPDYSILHHHCRNTQSLSL